jgi:hypothetical protein
MEPPPPLGPPVPDGAPVSVPPTVVVAVVGVVDSVVLVVVDVVVEVSPLSLEPHAASSGVAASAALMPTTADHRRNPRQELPFRAGVSLSSIAMVGRLLRRVVGPSSSSHNASVLIV